MLSARSLCTAPNFGKDLNKASLFLGVRPGSGPGSASASELMRGAGEPYTAGAEPGSSAARAGSVPRMLDHVRPIHGR